jgi:hypothetical protein
MYVPTTEQSQVPVPRVIDIELLALDLTTCTRCVGTLEHIGKAIDIVRPVLEAMGVQVNTTSRVIESEEQARQHQFVASPTVRINGKDIVFEVLESGCESCTDLCSCSEGTSCRVWLYHGQEYTEAPVGLGKRTAPNSSASSSSVYGTKRLPKTSCMMSSSRSIRTCRT